jgi:hypothetical protein
VCWFDQKRDRRGGRERKKGQSSGRHMHAKRTKEWERPWVRERKAGRSSVWQQGMEHKYKEQGQGDEGSGMHGSWMASTGWDWGLTTQYGASRQEQGGCKVPTASPRTCTVGARREEKGVGHGRLRACHHERRGGAVGTVLWACTMDRQASHRLASAPYGA